MEQEQIMDDSDRGTPAGGPGWNRESCDTARTGGTTTSAMVRDAARLRTVMTRAGDRESSSEAAGITVPLPEPDHRALEHSGYGATRLAMPRQASPSSMNAESARASAGATASGGATRLRPISALGVAESGSVKPAAPTAMAGPENKKPAAPAAAAVPSAMPASAPAEEKTSGHSAAQSSQGPAARNDVWDVVSTAAVPKMASDSWDQIPHGTYREKKKRGVRKGMAAACTVLGGSVLGIALYAGGSGFLSGIFSNRTEGVQMRSPSAVTERPQAMTQVPPPVQDSTPIAAALPESATPEVVTPPAAERRENVAAERVPAAAVPRPQRPAPGEPEKRQPEPVSSVPASRSTATAATETSRRNATPRNETRTGVTNTAGSERQPATRTAQATREEGKPSTSKYMVQVKATPSEDEANRVAKKLRSKGIGNVQVVRSEKDGAPFYRVRFTGTGTSGEAKEKAKVAGFSDIWVVKQD